MTTASLAWFDRMIPPALLAHPRQQRAARHLALLGAITALSAPLLGVMYHLLGFDGAGLVVLGGGAVMVLAPLALSAGLPLARARDLFVGALFLLKIWLALHLGGLAASTVPWFALCPMVAVLVGGARPGIAWGALVLATLGALFVLGRLGAVVTHPVADPQLLELASHVGLVALCTIIALCLHTAGEAPRATR